MPVSLVKSSKMGLMSASLRAEYTLRLSAAKTLAALTLSDMMRDATSMREIDFIDSYLKGRGLISES